MVAILAKFSVAAGREDRQKLDSNLHAIMLMMS
jgi:hypothetical protein